MEVALNNSCTARWIIFKAVVLLKTSPIALNLSVVFQNFFGKFGGPTALSRD